MPLTKNEISSLIMTAFPDATLELNDTMGDNNHYSAKIISKTFNGKSKLSTWIYRVTYNEAIQWIRKNKKEFHLNISEIQKDNQPTTNIFNKDAYEISILLEKAILQLPEKQKMVFQLKYFEDLSYKEIQIIIGGSIGGLKANYHHAVTKIEKLLSSD